MDSTKKVEVLGKFKLPLEVIPFASNHVLRNIQLIKRLGNIRFVSGKPFITDQGNYIIDTDFSLINDPVFLSDKLNSIEGIVAHGLFIKLASKVIMGHKNSPIIFTIK